MWRRDRRCLAISLVLLFFSCPAVPNECKEWFDQKFIAESVRMVGGKLVDHRAVPWQVSIRINGIHQCGGALIARDLVLTAAHCLEGVHAFQMTVGFGSNLASKTTTRAVQSIHSHPEYLPGRHHTQGNDIGVIKLAADVPEEVKQADPLPPVLQRRLDTEGCAVVAGWGYTIANVDKDEVVDSGYSDELQGAGMPLIDRQTCEAEVGHQVPADQICAGGGEIDSCYGDSGGGLVVEGPGQQWHLAGIVSWGPGCGQKKPGMYSSVTHHLSWLREVIAQIDATAAEDKP